MIRKENPFWRAACIMNEFANTQDRAKAIREAHMARVNYQKVGRQDAHVFFEIQRIFKNYKTGR